MRALPNERAPAKDIPRANEPDADLEALPAIGRADVVAFSLIALLVIVLRKLRGGEFDAILTRKASPDRRRRRRRTPTHGHRVAMLRDCGRAR